MTSYLAAIAARDVDAVAGGEASRGIMPRVASAHEPWTIPPVDESANPPRPSDHDTSKAAVPREPLAHAVETRQRQPVGQSIGDETARPITAAAKIERIESVKRDEPPSVEREHRGDRRVEMVVTTNERLPVRESRSQNDPPSREATDHSSPARPRDQDLLGDSEHARKERDGRSHNPAPPSIVSPRPSERVTVAPRPRDAQREEAGARDVASRRTAEPTVIVTIGRIEVRAVTAQPTTSPPARAESRSMMSLEDYLQQRMRGAR